jgi:uncharacterized protein (TIGR02186 family)
MKIIFFFAIYLISYNTSIAKVVMDLSKHTINISRNFKGTDVTVFGVCDKDEDIIIMLRGGTSNLKIKKMHKKNNIWSVDFVINFLDMPNIYTLYSNKKIDNLLSEDDIDDLNLSISGLPVKEKLNRRDDILYLYESFNAMIKQRKLYNLLGDYPYSIEKIDNSTLFRVKLNIPDRIKTGTYSVVVYSVKDKKITSVVAVPLNIRKVGVSGVLHYLAFNYSKTFAILSIVWAMFVGWFVNYIIQAIIDKNKAKSLHF